MFPARTALTNSLLTLFLLVSNGAASVCQVTIEEPVTVMEADLRAFCDGRWFTRLVDGTHGLADGRRIAVIRNEIRDALDRHDDTFRALPATEQEAFLGRLMELLAEFEPLPGSADPSAARVLSALDSWRLGYRFYLVTRYTQTWQSRTETLLKLLRTLRIRPDAENLVDGSLLEGSLRYVHERYGSTGNTAISDAQLLLLQEFRRFEQAVRSLDTNQQFDLWCRWHARLRKVDARRASALPARLGVSEVSVQALVEWSLDRASAFERRLRSDLARPEVIEGLRTSPVEPSSRLTSMIRRLAPRAIEEEARHWWLHSIDPKLPTTLRGCSSEELNAHLLHLPAPHRTELTDAYERTVSVVRERRFREAALRSNALNTHERTWLRRELWIAELALTSEETQ